MDIIVESFILGGSFFFLILFSIFLLMLKDESLVQLPRMQRYLGLYVLLTSISLFYMYVELVYPNHLLLHAIKMINTVCSVSLNLFIVYKIISLIVRRISVPVTAEVTETKKSERGVVEEQEVVEEESDDDTATDENGELIPQPSEDNMDDIIFFQKLEALMAKKKLFCEQDITREQIAAEIGTNRTYLVRSIKFATGMTFNEYLNNLRTNYAAALLTSTDEPLDYIGVLSGFKSKSAYYRSFSAANNCSPSEYRNRNR